MDSHHSAQQPGRARRERGRARYQYAINTRLVGVLVLPRQVQVVAQLARGHERAAAEAVELHEDAVGLHFVDGGLVDAPQGRGLVLQLSAKEECARNLAHGFSALRSLVG